MILKIGGTIPCAEYGNLQVAWELEVPVEAKGWDSEWLDAAQKTLLTRYEAIWNEYSDKPMAKDVRKAREERVERLMEKAGMWLSSGWITQENHDTIVNGAAKAPNNLLSQWEARLDAIGQEKKKEAAEKRKAEQKEPTSEVTPQ